MMLRMIVSMCVLAGLMAVQPLAAQSATPAQGRNGGSAKPATMVNLNTASAAELQTLPGVGAKMAERIIEYRQKKGPFKKIEELMNVQGIGEKNFLKLRSQLTVGSTTSSSGQ